MPSVRLPKFSSHDIVPILTKPPSRVTLDTARSEIDLMVLAAHPESLAFAIPQTGRFYGRTARGEEPCAWTSTRGSEGNSPITHGDKTLSRSRSSRGCCDNIVLAQHLPATTNWAAKREGNSTDTFWARSVSSSRTLRNATRSMWQGDVR